jgi:hypothetical protein
LAERGCNPFCLDFFYVTSSPGYLFFIKKKRKATSIRQWKREKCKSHHNCFSNVNFENSFEKIKHLLRIRHILIHTNNKIRLPLFSPGKCVMSFLLTVVAVAMARPG